MTYSGKGRSVPQRPPFDVGFKKFAYICLYLYNIFTKG